MAALSKNTPRTEVNIGHRFVDPVAAAIRRLSERGYQTTEIGPLADMTLSAAGRKKRLFSRRHNCSVVTTLPCRSDVDLVVDPPAKRSDDVIEAAQQIVIRHDVHLLALGIQHRANMQGLDQAASPSSPPPNARTRPTPSRPRTNGGLTV